MELVIMAIEKKQLKDVSGAMKKAFQKASDVARSDIEYALILTLDLVKIDPGFIEARTLLRRLELTAQSKLGGFKKFMNSFKVSAFISKGKKAMAKKDFKAAINFAEDALSIQLNSPAALNLLGEAAVNEKAYFIAIDACEMLCNFNPSDVATLNKLAIMCERGQDGEGALRARQRICDLKPGDMDAQQRMREAAALMTLNRGDWEKEGSFQSKVKNADQAKKLEQQDRIVRSEDDVAALIVDLEGQIAAGDESIDKRRQLALYYQRSGRHPDAIEAYRWIAQKTGRLDPEIDKAIEKSEVAIFDTQIEADPTRAAELEQEKFGLMFSRAEARVNAYPNDLQLRYEYAELCMMCEELDTALEQFQMAQRNPQRRLQAIVYIGRIFHAKKQYDMATEQFEKALKEMLIMDATKMDTLYYFGLLCDDAGRKEKAMECYRTIYQANVRYRDIKQRVEG